VRNEESHKSRRNERLKKKVHSSSRLFTFFTNCVRFVYRNAPEAKRRLLQCSLSIEKEGVLCSTVVKNVVRYLH